MKPAIFALSALVAFTGQAFAQQPDDGKEPTVALCDRLAGAAREQCLRDERARTERGGPRRELAGSCDALIGPEKERCLRKGGTVEAGAQPGAGASRPPQR